MRSVTDLLSICLILGSLACLASRSEADDNRPAAKIRIGTYDNRAVAIAYAQSRFSPVAQRKLDFDKAKAAGDEAKMNELKAWGAEFQRQLHFQGFGRVPVDDLLQPVKEQLARLARDKQLAAVTMSCEFTSEQVEVVDITEDLVKLFDPPEKAWKNAREIRKVKPVKLTELGKMPADH
jgi:hypothetical protein